MSDAHPSGEPAPLANERCPDCTRIVHAEWSFCPSCGSSLEDHGADASSEDVESIWVYRQAGATLFARDYEIAYQEVTGYPSREPHDQGDDHEETADIEIWFWEPEEADNE